MPKVRIIQKARASKKTRLCTACRKEIEVGQAFYVWSFRYGGDRFRHVTCGRPRQSELTQSLMSEVYAAVEAYEDLGIDAEWADKASAAEDVANVADEVAQQYESAAESFGQSGENQERYEALSEWAEGVREAAEKMSAAAEALAEADEADSVIHECPL